MTFPDFPASAGKYLIQPPKLSAGLLQTECGATTRASPTGLGPLRRWYQRITIDECPGIRDMRKHSEALEW